MAAAAGTTVAQAQGVNGGRFDFDDAGTYCGGWEDGKAHGAEWKGRADHVQCSNAAMQRESGHGKPEPEETIQ